MEHREAYLGSSQTQTSGRELLYEKCQRFLAVNIKHVFDYTILSSSFGVELTKMWTEVDKMLKEQKF